MVIQYSIQKMVSDGTLSTIALGIQYLQRSDIYIRIAGEETPQSGAPSGYTWSFLDNTTLKILPVVPNGVEVVVYRRTDVDVMYNIYSQNAQFDEATIDENNQQLLYIAQEYLEQGLPGTGVDTIEYVRDDGSFTYYRMRRTDGSYSEEFTVPSASNSTKVLTRESLRRSYAEAGYNLVDGSFEAGGTLVNANDVLLQESTGKAFSGPAGVVVAGTNPSSGGFVDRSGELLSNTVSRNFTTTNITPATLSVGDDLSFVDLNWGRFSVTSSIPNGGAVSPDCVSLGGGKYAVKADKGQQVRSGVFKTKPELGHRVGQIKYLKRPNGSAEILTDLSKFKPNLVKEFATTVAYADHNRPDNTGDGLTWATAKRNISSATALNPDILYVKGGMYSRANRLDSFTVSKDMAIIAVGGPVIQGTLAKGAWSKTAGATNVYQMDYEAGLTNTTSSVLDTAFLNAQNAPSSYVSKASIAEVDANPGSFFHSGTTTYVHAGDSRDLVVHGDEMRLIQPVAGLVITYSGNHKLYMEGIECWYGGTGGSDNVRIKGNGSVFEQSVFYNKDCVFAGCRDGGGGNGIAIKDIGLCISDHSKCLSNRRDGFNYHYGNDGRGGGTTLSPHYVEINCIANGNGVGGSENNNQGSTAHEACVGFRIGGDYSGHADGGNIVDIDASKCHLVNVSCNNSSIVGALLSADPWAGAPGVRAEWWVDGMWLTGNPPISNGKGDLAMDGYNSRLHFIDVLSDKPVSTRSFSTPPDGLV